jgi:hypothetical protein
MLNKAAEEKAIQAGHLLIRSFLGQTPFREGVTTAEIH